MLRVGHSARQPRCCHGPANVSAKSLACAATNGRQGSAMDAAWTEGKGRTSVRCRYTTRPSKFSISVAHEALFGMCVVRSASRTFSKHFDLEIDHSIAAIVLMGA